MNKYAAFLLMGFFAGGCVDDYRLRYLGETDPDPGPGGPVITPPDKTAPTVEFWIADGLTSAYRNMAHYFTFSETMAVASVTTNTANAVCSGSLQISSDNFVTCLQMVGAPLAIDGIIFSIKPVSNLSSLTAYNVRVTTAVRDLAGNAMAAEFTMPTGFTTGSNMDYSAPLVDDINPSDSAFSIGIGTNITIRFGDNMQPNTVTANSGSDTTCSGSVQVSADSYVTCVPMKRQMSSPLEEFVFTPLSALLHGTTYQIRIRNTVADKAGNTMISDYATVTGFSTAP